MEAGQQCVTVAEALLSYHCLTIFLALRCNAGFQNADFKNADFKKMRMSTLVPPLHTAPRGE
jgi:hypothetical protein